MIAYCPYVMFCAEMVYKSDKRPLPHDADCVYALPTSHLVVCITSYACYDMGILLFSAILRN